MSRPPWLVILHLPDDTPPASVDLHVLACVTEGWTACALSAEAAEAVLAAIPEDVRP